MASSDNLVLRSLQEFRREKEKEKAKKQEEDEQTNQRAAEEVVKNEKHVVKNSSSSANGGDWDFLTRSEPVAEDYEDQSIIPTPLVIVVYAVGQALAAWVQFGCVFFILSAILLTYWNTGRRRRGEMSAYSVFNANCERLAGSMTAEHFERDMLRQRR